MSEIADSATPIWSIRLTSALYSLTVVDGVDLPPLEMSQFRFLTSIFRLVIIRTRIRFTRAFLKLFPEVRELVLDGSIGSVDDGLFDKGLGYKLALLNLENNGLDNEAFAMLRGINCNELRLFRGNAFVCDDKFTVAFTGRVTVDDYFYAENNDYAVCQAEYRRGSEVIEPTTETDDSTTADDEGEERNIMMDVALVMFTVLLLVIVYDYS